jgi:hypothetical protein
VSRRLIVLHVQLWAWQLVAHAVDLLGALIARIERTHTA